MPDDLTPAEQARAARWAKDWLSDAGFDVSETARDAMSSLSFHADKLDPPETVESLRAERDAARDETKRVSERWLKDARERSEELFLTKAALDDADATIARLRATHTQAEAAWGRCQRED